MDAKKDAEQREYEERLQRRLKILKQQFEQGKIHIAEGLKVTDSLKAVRALPDGTIDLSTVDGLVRSMALMAEHIHDGEELKKANPLAEIQKTYFDFLHTNFGHFYEIMVERGLTPHEAFPTEPEQTHRSIGDTTNAGRRDDSGGCRCTRWRALASRAAVTDVHH